MTFKIGDKIILKKEVEMYSMIAWAEVILEILEVNFDGSYKIRILPNLDRKLIMKRVPDYRLATEREIKIDKIKKIFKKKKKKIYLRNVSFIEKEMNKCYSM